MACELKLYHNFLIEKDCDRLLKKYSDGLQESQTLGRYIEGYRVAENRWIYDIEDPLIKGIVTRISMLTGKPIENQEKPNLIKYDIGGEYKHHHDYFSLDENFPDQYENCMNQGGQRTHTAILYLNDDFTGGETDFPSLGIKVTPQKGLLCIWNNVNELGEVEPDSFHAGLPVITGRKWILISWVRERAFGT